MSAPAKNQFRPTLESLEDRQLLSWSSIPSTFGWPASANVSFNSNGRSGTGAITHNEVNVYNFVAPRSGTYTFSAGMYGSRIDTVAALYQWNGRLLAGNDDANSNTTDSLFTAYLSGGTRYAFAVTNYTGSSTGGYRWSITGPPLSASVSNNAGDGITSFGSATLKGNSLTVYLAGDNASNWYTYTHRIDVYLVDGNNNPIHSGSWYLTFQTGGTLVPGIPSSDNMTQTWDLSGFDLRGLRNIEIYVS
jgi:hypothetical protein